jgi:hypothetical protein
LLRLTAVIGGIRERRSYPMFGSANGAAATDCTSHPRLPGLREPAAIELDNISLTFSNGLCALESVSFAVRCGEFVSLL